MEEDIPAEYRILPMYAHAAQNLPQHLFKALDSPQLVREHPAEEMENPSWTRQCGGAGIAFPGAVAFALVALMQSRRATGTSPYAAALKRAQHRPCVETISGTYRELTAHGRTEPFAQPAACVGFLAPKSPVVAPISKQPCAAFCTAVLQLRSDGTMRTVANATGTAPSALCVTEQGERGEAVVLGVAQGEVRIRQPDTAESEPLAQLLEVDPLAVLQPSGALQEGDPQTEGGVYMCAQGVDFQVAATDPDDILDKYLGIGHSFLANKHQAAYRLHAGYRITEALLPLGTPVTVVGHLSAPNKATTLLPTVVIENSSSFRTSVLPKGHHSLQYENPWAVANAAKVILLGFPLLFFLGSGLHCATLFS